MGYLVPFPGSYWVVPGSLLAGCYPALEITGDSGTNLTGLLNHGIRHIINLMEPGEFNRPGNPEAPYEDRIIEIAESMGVRIGFGRYPIPDMGIPGATEMAMILDEVDQAVETGRPVYVHCWGGLGRTGTVVGCYLARHGIARGLSALEKIRELRRETPDRNAPSPQTGEQVDMVLYWGVGE